MSTDGKKILFQGEMSLALYTNFDAGTKGAHVPLNNWTKNATVTENSVTGDATAAGDDAMIYVPGRESYEFTFELFRSRSAAGPLATLGLVGAVTDLGPLVKRYYEVKLQEETGSGKDEVTFNVLCNQLVVIQFDAASTDASSMSLTWPVVGKMGQVVST